MALSMPPPHTVWDGTLPSPTALLSIATDPRRASSVLHHHLSSDPILRTTSAVEDEERRSTAPCLAGSYVEKEKLAIEYERGRQESTMSGESAADSSSEAASPPEDLPGYCLCVPEPKIPRPRNAFILYRQHQHASVVAKYPGLPNPDISKIIGEQWRELSSKDKEEWKTLAEQEKARHSQKFPDYRYRPKRNGKYQQAEGTPVNTIQATNCSKCGGRNMNPPHTPHYAGFDALPPPIVGMPRPQKRAFTEAPVAPARAQPMTQIAPHPHTAPMRYTYQPTPRHDSIQYVQPPPMQQHPPHYAQVEGHEAKRRRMNPAYPARPSYDHAYYDQHRAPAPYHPDQVPRHPMPQSQRGSHPLPAPPAAGPRPSMAAPQQRRDPSLTLPPLKTGINPRSSVSPNVQTQKSGVEAMIMSYPVLSKLKTIQSITPILSNPGPTSPSHEVRGAIIAVEGLDSNKVQDMTTSLAEQLEREGKFFVRIFAGPDPYQALHSSRRASVGQNGDQMSTQKYLNLIYEWHKVSKDMVDFITHKPRHGGEASQVEALEDHEMKDSSLQQEEKPTSPFERISSRKSPISAVSPRTIEKTSDMSIDTPTSEKLKGDLTARVTRSRIPQAAIDQQRQQEETEASETLPPPPPSVARPQTPPPPPTTEKQSSDHETDISRLMPVAIVPHYQLTTVDTCSIALPITDNYDPLTHWRWHATLWRGCIGPDISVVIKSAHEQYEDDNPTDGKKPDTVAPHNHGRSGSVAGPPRAPDQAQAPNQVASTTTAPSSAITSASAPTPFGVEVRLQDHRAVIVRAGHPTRGSNASDALTEKDVEKEKDNWEKAKRRVGFEVEESLRR